MATYKPGDRVRIVCPASLVNGRCGTVTSAATLTRHYDQRWWNRRQYRYDVTVDGMGALDPYTGHRIAFEACELAPIQPERNQATSWEAVGWHPSDFLKGPAHG